MRTVFLTFLSALRPCFQSGACLQVENLALRYQINVLRRSGRRRLRLSCADRLLWVCLSRLWTGWRSALVIVKPETKSGLFFERSCSSPADGFVRISQS
jgi:hypothetical protein